MKKILNLTAVTLAMTFALGATAFGACPLKAGNTACSMNSVGVPTGAAAPVSYIVAPVAQRTYIPPCNNCNKVEKKSFMQKIFSPVRGIYDATLGPIFTQLY